jgi:predicted enzyme related to lactoylglutathione lyase
MPGRRRRWEPTGSDEGIGSRGCGEARTEVRALGAPVTWFEINTGDAKAVREFYAELFDWNLQVLEEANYTLVDTGHEGAIEGGIGEAQGPNQVTFYIEVDDPGAYLDRIEQAGGTTVVPVTATEMVTFAQFADPQGNVVGLVKAVE